MQANLTAAERDLRTRHLRTPAIGRKARCFGNLRHTGHTALSSVRKIQIAGDHRYDSKSNVEHAIRFLKQLDPVWSDLHSRHPPIPQLGRSPSRASSAPLNGHCLMWALSRTWRLSPMSGYEPIASKPELKGSPSTTAIRPLDHVCQSHFSSSMESAKIPGISW